MPVSRELGGDGAGRLGQEGGDDRRRVVRVGGVAVILLAYEKRLSFLNTPYREVR